MKATGLVRKIDEIGRLVIPKEVRETMQLQIGTNMEIFIDSDKIILSKYQPVNSCRECGRNDRPLYGKTGICKPCISKLSEQE